MSTLAPMLFGTVIGRCVSIDNPPKGASGPPVVNPLSGDFTFTPAPNQWNVPTAVPDPTMAFPEPYKATLDSNGYISVNGTLGIQLPATDDPSLIPDQFTYLVTPSNLKRTDGSPVTWAPFSIAVPAGTVVDLITVAPIAFSNGVAITKGDPGETPTFSIGTVTTTTDLNAASVSFDPTSTALSKILDFVLPVGAGSGGGAGTVTTINQIAPDGSGNVTLSAASVGAATIDSVTTAQSTASSALTTANAAQAGLANKADVTALGSYAPLSSPALTGNPTAPTPATSDSDASIATTAFVKAVIASLVSTVTNSGMVGWNATTKTWGTRPSTSGPVKWVSTNDATATNPTTVMATGDNWEPHPDAVIS